MERGLDADMLTALMAAISLRLCKYHHAELKDDEAALAALSPASATE